MNQRGVGVKSPLAADELVDMAETPRRDSGFC